LYGPQDFVPGFAAEAVISDGLWRRAYAPDPNVLGRNHPIDNDPLTIIGFCHADFAILDRRLPATRIRRAKHFRVAGSRRSRMAKSAWQEPQ